MSVALEALREVGTVAGQVIVNVGPRFLELFSEHMYSSPNKAFEELITNSWDAGASVAYVGASVSEQQGALWVLDDGASMTQAGLQQLWNIASPHKRDSPREDRPPIGKFGVGKLATYLLANELTYICKADYGTIRAVSMDYRRIDDLPGDTLAVAPISLDVRQLSASEVRDYLSSLSCGAKISELIDQGVPRPEGVNYDNEFGGPDSKLKHTDGTWTLVLLTDLKEAGKGVQPGRMKQILRAALPLGSTMCVVFDDEPLTPKKLSYAVVDEWVIGATDVISELDVPELDSVKVHRSDSPFPHVTIDGFPGKITGTIRRYQDRISGGKSDDLQRSNGFFVNVLGRVINIDDPYFGLENLNHAVWSRFRATIRADGLDEFLSVNREGLASSVPVRIFRTYLRGLFNEARTRYDSAASAAWPDISEVLQGTWGAVPLEPLHRVVLDHIDTPATMPSFIDVGDPAKLAVVKNEWQESARTDPTALLVNVELEDRSPEGPLAVYDLANRRVIVNKAHPFAVEHGRTQEEQVVLRDSALAQLLTEAYMQDAGIDPEMLETIREYRDQVLRLVAHIRRQTGPEIARILVDTTTQEKPFEVAVGDALEYLGFGVHRMGEPGKPEGIAFAPVAPEVDDERVLYRLTYDAKSTGNGKVSTGNVHVSGLARHRDTFNADHALVVAPDFQDGALTAECTDCGVTPMRARDLAALLMCAATVGPVDLSKIRAVFDLGDPDEVGRWVDDFIQEHRSTPHLSLDLFLRAFGEIGYRGTNPITASVIADRISTMVEWGGLPPPRREDVLHVARALGVLMPKVVRVAPREDIFIGTTPKKLRDGIVMQLQAIPAEFRFGMEEVLNGLPN